MSEEQKRPVGLFRLADLEVMEVEDEKVFPDATEAPVDVTGTGSVEVDQMAAAIRRARQLHGSNVDNLAFDEPEALQPSPPPPSDAAHAMQPAPQTAPPGLPTPRTAAGYDTANTEAVIAAASAAMIKGRRTPSKLILLGLVFVMVIGALAAVLLVLVSEPKMLDTIFPIEQPSLVQQTSESAILEISLIPEPPVLEEPAPVPTRTRDRSMDRNRDRRGDLDESSLF